MVKLRSGRIVFSFTYEAIDCADDGKVISLLLDAPIDIFTSFFYNLDEKSMNEVMSSDEKRMYAVMRAVAEGLTFILELIITAYPSSMDLKNKVFFFVFHICLS